MAKAVKSAVKVFVITLAVATGAAFLLGGTGLASFSMMGAFIGGVSVSTIAAMSALSTLVGGLMSKGTDASSENFGTKVATRTATAPRQIIYGKARVGGTITHIETSGTDNYKLSMIVVLAGHEVESLEEVLVNDVKLTTTSSGGFEYATNSKFTNSENANKFTVSNSLLRYKFKDGSQTTADSNITSATSLGSTDKFIGMAYMLIEFVFDSEAFGGGIPPLSFVVKGKKVYDPRSGQTAFTDSTGKEIGSNPALCVRDYLIDTTYGLKATSSEINDTTALGGFASAANTCETAAGAITTATVNGAINSSTTVTVDTASTLTLIDIGQTVTGTGITGTVTVIKRTGLVVTLSSAVTIADGVTLTFNEGSYKANGITNMTADGAGIIEGLLSSCAGKMSYINGKFVMFAGASVTPEMTITDDNLLAPISITTKQASGETFNTVKAVYVDGNNNYVATDSPTETTINPSTSVTFLSEDTPTGESQANYRKNLEIQLPFTDNTTMAQRLQRTAILHSRQEVALSALCNIAYMQLQPFDWVYLTNERLGYTNKVFEVLSTNLEVMEQDDVSMLATRLDLKEIDSSVYAFASSSYTSPIDEGSSVSTGSFSVTAPTNLSLTVDLQLDSTTSKVNIDASWTNNPDDLIQGTEILYGTSSGTYIGSVLVGKGKTKAVIPNLMSNSNYYVVARHFSSNNVFSANTGQQTVNTGLPSAPSAPSSLSATTGKALVIGLQWTAPSNSDLRAVKVYRHTSNFTPTNDTYLVSTITSEPSQVQKLTFGLEDGLTAGTTYHFAVRAINHSGTHSTFTSTTTGSFALVDAGDIDLPDFSGYFHKEGNTTTALTSSQFNTEYGRTPLTDDILIMVNTSATPKVSKAYKWNGSAFVEINNFTTGDLVVDGTLAGDKIIAQTISADRVDTDFITTLNLLTTSATITNNIVVGTGNNVFKAETGVGIHLGHATFSSAPFSVTQAGVLKAQSGTIGGINLANNKLYVGTGTVNNSNTAFYLDSSGNFSLKDKLYWNGTTLVLDGQINATTGAIGGFEIGTTSIIDDADSFGLSSAVTAGDDVRFFAGNTLANKNIAPFKVTESGALTATSATITGALTLTNIDGTTVTYTGGSLGVGTIGGGNLGSSAIFPTTLRYERSNATTAPSTSEFNTAFGRDPRSNDVVVVSRTDTNAQVAYKHNGTSFSAVSNYIDGDLIVGNSITASEIATGTLTSASGVFGVISANNISTGTLNASNVTVTNLNATNISSGTLNVARLNVADIISTGNIITTGTVIANAINVNSGVFTVSTAGVMSASGASVTGTFVAGSGTNIFTADSDGIYLGNGTFANAPFKALNTGEVQTTKSFTAGVAGTSEIAKMAGSGNYRFWSGAEAPANASFSVDKVGKVIAKNLVLKLTDGTVYFDSETGFSNSALSQISITTGTKVSTVSNTFDADTEFEEITVTEDTDVNVSVSIDTNFGGNSDDSSTNTAIDESEAEVPENFTLTIQHSSNGGSSYNTVVTDTFTRVNNRANPKTTPASDEYKINTETEQLFIGGQGGVIIIATTTTSLNLGCVDSDGRTILASTGLTLTGISTGTTHRIKATVSTTDTSYDTTNNNVSSTTPRVVSITDPSGDGFYVGDSGGSQVAPSGDITRVQITTASNSGLTGGANFASGDALFSLALASTIAGNKTFSNNVIIGGNLDVQGTTTTVNTDDLNVKDKNITLNYSTGDSSALSNGAGITIQDAVNSTTNATILWDKPNSKFTTSHGLNITGTIDADLLSIGNNVGNTRGVIDANATYYAYYNTETSPRIQLGRDVGISGGAGLALGGNSSYALIGTNNTSGSAMYFKTASAVATVTTNPDMTLNSSGNLTVRGAITSSGTSTFDAIDVGQIEIGDGGATNDSRNIGSKSNFLLIQRDEAVPIEMWGSNIQSRTTHYFGGSSTDAEANIDTSGNFTTTGTITTSGVLQVNVGTASHQRFRITRPSSTTAALYMGVDSSNNAMIAANNSATRIGKDVSGTFYEYLTITSAGNVNVKNNLEINGQTVISGARNITAGTISSGNIDVTSITAGQGASIEVHATTNEWGNALLIAKSDNANTFIHAGVKIHGSGNPFYIYQSNGSATNTLRFNYNGFSDTGGQMTIAANGDISFYEDTGTTAKLFWDASAESLGIGTTSPLHKLAIGGNSTQVLKSTVAITDMTNGASLSLRGQAPTIFFDSTSAGIPTILMDGRGIEFKDGTLDSQGNVDVKIDASGNVGIGTDSPSEKLTVDAQSADGVTTTIASFHSNEGESGDTAIQLAVRRSDALGSDRKTFLNATGAGNFEIQRNGSTKATLDASGNTTFAGTISSGAITATGVSVLTNVKSLTDLFLSRNDGTSPAVVIEQFDKFRFITDSAGNYNESQLGVNPSNVLFTNNGYAINTTTVIDSSRNLSVALINSATITATSGTDQRVLKLKQASTNTGNIIQFLDQADANQWEITGRNNGFYIYKNTGTGSGMKYQISSSGSHTFTGDATFSGTIDSGAITSSASSTIQGNLLLDASSAEINLKSGIGTESGAVNWTFNTTGTDYASLKLPYGTRATTGFHVDSAYPITVDATTRINFAISGNTRFRITNTNFEVGTTPIIDLNRNLTNIGTISSGYIQSSNQIKSTHTGASPSIWASTTDGYMQVGPNGGGASGVFGAHRETTGTGALDYTTYIGYDTYYDDGTKKWYANRTNLGRKWKTNFGGYHQNRFSISTYDGGGTTGSSLSAGWLEADWDERFGVDASGNGAFAGQASATIFNATNGFRISGTTVIDSSRNLTISEDLNFSTNGFADISNTGTGAIRFKPSSQTLALTLTGANATFAGTISSGEITTTAPQFKYVSNTDSNVGLLIRDETYVSNETDITATRLASGSSLTLGLAGQVGINAYIGGVNKFSINSAGNATFAGTVTATGGNSTNWNTAYTVANAALPKAGGFMTGNVFFSDSGTTKRGIQGQVGTNDYWFFGGGATASNSGFVEIAAGDDGSTAGSYEPIYVRQYLGTPLAGSVQRTLTLLDNNGNTVIPNSLTANGDITANSGFLKISASSTSEGGELTLLRPTSGTTDINLDNYQNYFRIHASGGIWASIDNSGISGNSFKVGANTVIDGSRNLSNIGNIDSTAINTSSSGTVFSGFAKSASFYEVLNAGSTNATATSPRFYSPASGTAAISAGGAERLRLSSTGATFTGTISSGAITSEASTHYLGGIKIALENTAQNYIVFSGTTGDQTGNYNHTYIGERIYSGTESSELVLAKYNDVEGTAGSDRIRHIANNHVFDTYTSAVAPSVGADLTTAVGTGTLYTRMTIRQNGDIEVGGSKFVDSSRNITSGTISSGAITSSGNIAGATIEGYTFPSFPSVSGYLLRSDTSGNLQWTANAISSYTNSQDDRVITSTGSTGINGEYGLTYNKNSGLQLHNYNGTGGLSSISTLTLGQSSNGSGISKLILDSTSQGSIDFKHGTTIDGSITYEGIFSNKLVISSGTIRLSGAVETSSTLSSGAINTTGNVTLGTFSTTNTGTLILTGSSANKKAELKCTNGNLHIDSEDTAGTYINYFEGTGGIFFGTGAGGNQAHINNSGGINLRGSGTAPALSAIAVNGTSILDNSRNLTNIGTITASGIVNIGGGTSYFSEKLLVNGRTRVAGQLDIALGTGYGNYGTFNHDDSNFTIGMTRTSGTGNIKLAPHNNVTITKHLVLDDATRGIVHSRENLHGVPLEDGLSYFAFNHNTSAHPASESQFDTMERVNITTFKGLGTFSNANPFTLSADSYLVEFHGYLLITTAGDYRFGVNADDAVDMYIDGIRVADDYGGHGATGFFNDSSPTSIYLTVGYHKLFARFEEVGGGDSCQLGWNGGSGTTLVAIPTGNLYHNSTDLTKAHNGTTYTVGAVSMTGTLNSGAITSTGNVTAFSDKRLKTNIQTLDSKKALQMRGVSFTKDGQEGSGVIAQEVEKIAPELVLTADDEMGTKSVAYGNLIGYLIETVKYQQKEIESMKSQINKLQEK